MSRNRQTDPLASQDPDPREPSRQLPSRSAFYEHLRQATAQAERTGEVLALHLVDLGDVALGGAAAERFLGEEICRAVVTRLLPIIRRSDVVACLGGASFAILQRALANPRGATILARKILHSLSKPLSIRSLDARLHSTVGIAFHSPSLEARKLVDQARAALRRAREEGAGGLSYYAAPLDPDLRDDLWLHEDLHRALKRREFTLFFQPQVDLKDHRIRCAEALLRWRHPTRGILSPASFIPAAEETALISDLGLWVMEEAARSCRAWSRRDFPGVPVAVNLSAAQLRDPHLAQRIGEVLARSRLPPALLELEITESALVEELEGVRNTLDALRRLGVRFAIDDFGTGYSSLQYLATLPVSKIKIPRNFVGSLPEDRQKHAVVDAMVTVAHRLGLEVVAEGVETAAEEKATRALRCDTGQGFLFGRPESRLRGADSPIRRGAKIPPSSL